ncbi:MAG: Uncharacterised protein [SAR116 cluster bacterium]|nr:MAG: Uncharacterised protein [SAR116 cluster bacterium]
MTSSLILLSVGVSDTSLIFSPSSAKTAITEFTATPSVPSFTMILASTPSSIASTSMVALSVSISAITSPERTSSPCLTSHFDNIPSVIVGDKAGINISIAIFRSPPLCSRPAMLPARFHHFAAKLGLLNWLHMALARLFQLHALWVHPDSQTLFH